MPLARLAIELGEASGHQVVILRGVLNLSSSPKVRTVLTKSLLDRGHALVGVANLEVSWPPAVVLFASVLSAAGGWPNARMVLVGADEWLRAALDVVKVSAAVPLASTWQEAIQQIDTRPSVVRRHQDIAAGSKASEVARQAAREVCRDWGIADLVFPVTTIATELVTNAIEHTGLGCTLSYMLDARGVHIAVRDHRPATRADQRAMHDLLGTGYGLKVVENLARWGVIPHHDGKTVWASLPTNRPP